MLTGPATMIVVLVAGCLVIVGAIVMGNGKVETSSRDHYLARGWCNRCRRSNPADAKFCAWCGRELRAPAESE